MCFIEVRNRKLEQFLFLHGIDFISQEKDLDGMTVWKYANTTENRRIIEEFIRAQEIRANKTRKHINFSS